MPASSVVPRARQVNLGHSGSLEGAGAGEGGAGLGPHSSAVDCGMRSGILVSFRLEHSTTLASQRHLWGQTTSLLHSLFSW